MLPERFGYHRSVAPMMWVLVALATLELLAVHLLVSLLWSRTVAAILSLVTLASVGWLMWVIASMRRLPVLLDRDTLTMRVGTIKGATVRLADVAGLRSGWDAAALKDRSVLNLALIAYPNVVVDLARPLPGRRGILAIAHRLDDPVGFTAALDRRRGADASKVKRK